MIKRKVVVGVGVLLALLAAIVLAQPSSALRQAFDEREKLNWPIIAPYVQGMESYTRDQRWKNQQLQEKGGVRLGEVVRVQISKTIDTGETIIYLIDIHGHRSTIWTFGPLKTGEMPVRSITY